MKTATTLSIETKRPTAVAVGFFDGVHLGHRAVIESALAEQRNGLACCVFSFAMNGAVPAAKKGAKLLQSITLKKQVLEEMGADWLLIPHFSNIMGLTPEQFAVDVLLRGLHAQVVCCGYDYRFGKGASAGAAELAELLVPHGVLVRQVGAVLDEGQPVSSTRIRAALDAGRLEEANRLLGRPFAIDWTVEHGRKLGHKLGFPTANQHIGDEFARPRFGVYATRVLIDGVPFAGATNVGIKPTVGSDCVSAESYILDWEGDLYGRRIETQFLQFLRPEEKFETLDELRHAIGTDAKRAREIVSAFGKAGSGASAPFSRADF